MAEPQQLPSDLYKQEEPPDLYKSAPAQLAPDDPTHINKPPDLGFIGSRLQQLAGKEPGILNPNPEQNPLMAGENPITNWLGKNVPSAPGYLGTAQHFLFENLVKPSLSPLGAFGMAMGEPEREPIGTKGMLAPESGLSKIAQAGEKDIPLPTEMPQPQTGLSAIAQGVAADKPPVRQGAIPEFEPQNVQRLPSAQPKPTTPVDATPQEIARAPAEPPTALQRYNQTLAKAGDLAGQIMNTPRTLMASIDASAPLRQGLGLVHRAEFWKAIPEMFKVMGSDEAFETLQKSIMEKPTFELGQRSGLFLADTGLTNREEAFMSKIAEAIPGVKASERMYTGFLNKLRADTFESLINEAKGLGLDPENDQFLSQQIAKYVNTSTGRGSMGALAKNADLLNQVFFSPRLIASRLQMLNPYYYINPNTPAFVRQQALKSLFAVAGAAGTTVALGKLAGGEIEESPYSADFGKVRFGNTRLDPFGGFQQYVVAAARLTSGMMKSTTTGKEYALGSRYGLPTRFDIAERFGESKLNPMLSFATELLHGKTPAGQSIPVTKELADRFIPLLIQDIRDIYNDDPRHLGLAIPGAFGMGLQTYGPTQQQWKPNQ